MPTESFERSVDVSFPTSSVWDVLTDVGRVAEWISVVGDVEERSPLEAYRATLEDRIGPFRLKADLNVDVTDVDPGRRISFVADGEDRQVSSRIRVEASLNLTPTETGTLVDVSGFYEVTGRVASLGTSTIRAKAKKILDEFFDQADRALNER